MATSTITEGKIGRSSSKLSAPKAKSTTSQSAHDPASKMPLGHCSEVVLVIAQLMGYHKNTGLKKLAMECFRKEHLSRSMPLFDALTMAIWIAPTLGLSGRDTVGRFAERLLSVTSHLRNPFTFNELGDLFMTAMNDVDPQEDTFEAGRTSKRVYEVAQSFMVLLGTDPSIAVAHLATLRR